MGTVDLRVAKRAAWECDRPGRSGPRTPSAREFNTASSFTPFCDRDGRTPQRAGPNCIRFSGILVGLLIATSSLRAAEPSKADLDYFESKIRPIFANQCYKCHSHESAKLRGGLSLEFRETMLKGGDTGPAIVPGKPEESLLIKAIGYGDADLQMPPKGEKLSDAQIADLTAWVKMGAPDPRTTNSCRLREGVGGVRARPLVVQAGA